MVHESTFSHWNSANWVWHSHIWTIRREKWSFTSLVFCTRFLRILSQGHHVTCRETGLLIWPSRVMLYCDDSSEPLLPHQGSIRTNGSDHRTSLKKSNLPLSVLLAKAWNMTDEIRVILLWFTLRKWELMAPLRFSLTSLDGSPDALRL